MESGEKRSSLVKPIPDKPTGLPGSTEDSTTPVNNGITLKLKSELAVVPEIPDIVIGPKTESSGTVILTVVAVALEVARQLLPPTSAPVA